MTDIQSKIQARAARHSRIDFDKGHYQKAKKQRRTTSYRFLKNITIVSAVFFFSYFLSFQFVGAYPQTPVNSQVQQINPEQVFVLQEDGFVLKPSTQTTRGDRSTSNEIINYVVESGDTLSGIAAKFGIRTQTLLDNNTGINSWTPLKIGKELTVLPVDGLLHTAKSSDSIKSIAAKYKVKQEDLLRQNKLEESSVIAGLPIIIPGAKKAPAPRRYGAAAPTYAPSEYNGVISGSYVWPANGEITQYFHRWHYALDIANRKKGPIYAMANGVVVKAQGGWNGGYGNMIIVDHGDGLKTLYAHNEKLYVKVGDEVVQGQTIAWMGNTGRVRGATGIHIHFEVIKNGVKKNPLAYIGAK